MICEDCTKGFELDGEPTGALQGVEYGNAYLASPADGATRSKNAVVLFTDIFGLALNNPKVLADQFAKALRVDVWVPDLFAGKPPVRVDELAPHTSPVPGAAKKTLWQQLKWYSFMVRKGPKLKQFRPEIVDPIVKQFLLKIKEQHGYERIGVVGYCFGGSLSLRLSSTDLIHGAVIAHPGGAPLDLVNAIKIPTVWLCAEEDTYFSSDARDAAERAMASRENPPHELIVYPGTTHGFAARPALQYPRVKEAFEKAFAKTVEFLNGVVNEPSGPHADA
ncbi:dienelactone hydrolase endo-1,3,1,4-beta-D-glucanase [Auricularia subglabra TFB-10046 SS5]|uniref:Dienelactone hydrolase endo-1,3,1,4-beta-D-glucanase n=1 Tax=Auricularia subglabra (strain TFB-10046 / SS5) TaxID=717982 RepID=J0CWM2_AURST|nr:dienelactone hydrolase endo-1,3,1,4-beta-D-glucanase [Auricularia subglabra TFB-10046 SS5]